MKHKSAITTGLIFLIIITMVSFAFNIHRMSPIGIQWLYAVVVIIMLIILYQCMYSLFSKKAKSFMLSTVMAFFTVLIFIIGLYQISSIRRESEALAFLQQNELKLKQLIAYKRTAGDSVKVPPIDSDLNIRILKVKEEEFHFELYSFLGYGYRIVFTEDPKMKMPKSPGGSPTLAWHRLKENWFYYSYLD